MPRETNEMDGGKEGSESHRRAGLDLGCTTLDRRAWKTQHVPRSPASFRVAREGDPCRCARRPGRPVRARQGDRRLRRSRAKRKKRRVKSFSSFRPLQFSTAAAASNRQCFSFAAFALSVSDRPALRRFASASVTMATTAPAGDRPAAAFKPLDVDTRTKTMAQMEFYFSDSNLPRDKFLRETVEADPDGFVDIGLLVTFSRMRALLAPFGGSHNDETIACVVELLKTSDQLTVSDDGKRVKRTAAVRSREEVDVEVERRSVYASPFAMTATIDDLTLFFGKHAAVRSVRLRRHITSKDFKGSVFVELENAGACQALIDGPPLAYEGVTIAVMMKKAYLTQKKADRVEKAEANAVAAAAAAVTNAAAKAAEPAGGDDDAETEETEKTADEDEKHKEKETPGAPVEFTPGLLLKFTLGAGVSDGVRREDVSEKLQNFGTIKFIDFKMGDTDGCVRFEDAAVVGAILKEHATTPLEIGNVPAAFELMAGDEETAYWAALVARAGQGGGGRGGAGRGGRGGGRGRGGARGGRGGRGGTARRRRRRRRGQARAQLSVGRVPAVVGR